MKNYVSIYAFNNPATTQEFKTKLKKEFPEHIQESGGGLPYFAFTAREEPGVEEALRHMVNESQLEANDFIALYFSRDDNPDQIKRVMVAGPDSMLEDRLKSVSEAEHNNKLTDLLEADIATQKANEQSS